MKKKYSGLLFRQSISVYIQLFLDLIGVGSFFWFDKYVSDVEDVQLSYSVVPIVVSLRLFTTSCDFQHFQFLTVNICECFKRVFRSV